ncbi:MAG: Nif3-like dinuclear metal center hexameric protein [Sphaerochaetaceae bacterium]|nr:Nif3-like dinuclear metal center hexameric protein [Sphaerochaetaceae bacterium]
MKLNDFVQHLSQMLDIGKFEKADFSLNGLQVGNLDKDIRKIAFAVDASLDTIKEAADNGADVLFVHHGLFWGRPIAITGLHYERVKTLLDRNLALFACHLPLDSNMEFGHNACIAKKLELENIQPFSLYNGLYVGAKGSLPKALNADEIIKKSGIITNASNYSINTEGKTFKNIGIVSGDGADDFRNAIKDGLDLLITGESKYSTVNDCREMGFSMLCLGHYETEVFGLKAMLNYVSSTMGLETCFIDKPLGL